MNSAVINILLVGAGSCLGGIARYLVGKGLQSVCHNAVFPWGTFAVNVVGCFIIGLIYGFIDRGGHMTDGMRLFLTVGFCGGFTTFSTFIHENYLLLNASGHLTLALYVAASVAAGFLMVYAAYALTRLY